MKLSVFRTRANSDVCTKYQEASKIVNLALTGMVGQCVPGARVIDLCKVSSKMGLELVVAGALLLGFVGV